MEVIPNLDMIDCFLFIYYNKFHKFLNALGNSIALNNNDVTKIKGNNMKPKIIKYMHF